MSNAERLDYLEREVFILQEANNILVGTIHDLVEQINLMNDTHYILYQSAPPKLELSEIYLDELDD